MGSRRGGSYVCHSEGVVGMSLVSWDSCTRGIGSMIEREQSCRWKKAGLKLGDGQGREAGGFRGDLMGWEAGLGQGRWVF